MDVLSIIKQEHREVSALFKEAENVEPHDERLRELAQQIMEQLSVHLSVEERLFYSELRDRAEDEENRVDMFEAYTEHAVAKALMEMLTSGRKPDERFKAELQVLGESVDHHVKEEESTVFGIAKHLLGSDEREAIGERWEKAKARAQRSASSNGSSKKKSTAKKSATARVTRGTTGGRKTSRKK